MDALEPDYAEAFNAWKAAPTPATSGAVLKAVRPVIDAAVRSYGGPNPGPLLTSRARRLVLDALPAYDPTRGPLRAHLDGQLRGLRRAAAEQAQVIHVPEQVRLDQHHVFGAETRLRDALGRDPTDAELADATGLSARRLAHIRKARDGVPEGALKVPGGGGEEYAPAVADADDDAWTRFVYGGLAPTDQLILEWTLGLNNKPVLSGREVAAKLGVTPAAVSQRKARIQAALDQRRSLGVL